MGKSATAFSGGQSSKYIYVKDGGVIMMPDLRYIGCGVYELVTDQPRLGCPPGTVFIYNKELAARSDANCMTYDDEFSAFRGMVQARWSYRNPKSGEIARLSKGCLEAESCIVLLRVVCDPRESEAFKETTNRLYGALRTVRNTEKEKGRERLQDARLKPETAEESLTKMIGHLQSRMEKIPEILANVDQRAVLLGAWIDDALVRHRTVREETQVPKGEKYPSRFRDEMQNLHRASSREQLIEKLRKLEALIRPNVARRPFKKSTERTAGYINDAVGILTTIDPKSRSVVRERLKGIFQRIFQEQEWVFVTYGIHQTILSIDLITGTDMSLDGVQEQVGNVYDRVLKLLPSSEGDERAGAIIGLQSAVNAFSKDSDRRHVIAKVKDKLKAAAVQL